MLLRVFLILILGLMVNGQVAASAASAADARHHHVPAASPEVRCHDRDGEPAGGHGPAGTVKAAAMAPASAAVIVLAA